MKKDEYEKARKEMWELYETLDRYSHRAKRKDNGEWIEGQAVTDGKKVWIIYDDDITLTKLSDGYNLVSDRFFEVIPETVEIFRIRKEVK